MVPDLNIRLLRLQSLQSEVFNSGVGTVKLTSTSDPMFCGGSGPKSSVKYEVFVSVADVDVVPPILAMCRRLRPSRHLLVHCSRHLVYCIETQLARAVFECCLHSTVWSLVLRLCSLPLNEGGRLLIPNSA